MDNSLFKQIYNLNACQFGYGRRLMEAMQIFIAIQAGNIDTFELQRRSTPSFSFVCTSEYFTRVWHTTSNICQRLKFQGHICARSQIGHIFISSIWSLDPLFLKSFGFTPKLSLLKHLLQLGASTGCSKVFSLLKLWQTLFMFWELLEKLPCSYLMHYEGIGTWAFFSGINSISQNIFYF